MLSKKSFLIDRRNFQGRWRVLRAATLGTKSFHTKTTTDRVIGPTEPCSSENIEDLTFARFSEFFDFRLFRHHRPNSDILTLRAVRLNSPGLVHHLSEAASLSRSRR